MLKLRIRSRGVDMTAPLAGVEQTAKTSISSNSIVPVIVRVIVEAVIRANGLSQKLRCC
jgi:hypothetical protein